MSSSGEDTFLESFVESISTLPNEIRRNLELMKELDYSSIQMIDQLKIAEDQYILRAKDILNNLTVETRRDFITKRQKLNNNNNNNNNNTAPVNVTKTDTTTDTTTTTTTTTNITPISIPKSDADTSTNTKNDITSSTESTQENAQEEEEEETAETPNDETSKTSLPKIESKTDSVKSVPKETNDDNGDNHHKDSNKKADRNDNDDDDESNKKANSKVDDDSNKTRPPLTDKSMEEETPKTQMYPPPQQLQQQPQQEEKIVGEATVQKEKMQSSPNTQQPQNVESKTKQPIMEEDLEENGDELGVTVKAPDTGEHVFIIPTTEEFRRLIEDANALSKIAAYRRDARQQVEEKVTIAEQTYAIVDSACKRLDSDLEKFESLLKGMGAFEAAVGAKPDDLAAIQVVPNSPDWILAKVITHDPKTGTFMLSDEDVESNKTFNLPEAQVVILGGGVDRLARGDIIYAVYPDTTSFYQATIVQGPRKVPGGESFVMVNFKDDGDENGITHDKAVPMQHVMRVPYGAIL